MPERIVCASGLPECHPKLGLEHRISSFFQGTLERSGRSPTVGAAVVRTGTDPLLERYLAVRYPRRTTIRRGTGRVDPRVHRDGVRAGERLVIREGVEGGRPPRRLLT